MPTRSRKRSTAQTQATETATPTNNNTTDTTTKESNKMALTPEQITELLADNRGRGDYGQFLKEFVESGSAGEQVNLESGLLSGKTADKAKTGLENAKKARDRDGALKLPEAKDVMIVKKGDLVFVINRGVTAGSTDDE